jgi:integrase
MRVLLCAMNSFSPERKLASGGDGRIFGTPAQLRRAAERGAAAMTAAGIGPLGIHDCRHTYASLMIAAGVNAKALSRYMGHSNIAITFDLYGHLMPGSHDEAAAPRTAPHPEQTAA